MKKYTQKENNKMNKIGLVFASIGVGAGVVSFIIGTVDKDFFLIYIGFICLISNLMNIKKYFEG
jgi:hypothetical protein